MASPPPDSFAEWVSIFSSPYRRPCEEQALVLRAMGLDHVVTERLDGCHLLREDVPDGLAAYYAHLISLGYLNGWLA